MTHRLTAGCSTAELSRNAVYAYIKISWRLLTGRGYNIETDILVKIFFDFVRFSSNLGFSSRIKDFSSLYETKMNFN